MYTSQRAHSAAAILRNDIVAFSDLAGSTSNQTTICVVIIISSLSSLPQRAFHKKGKRADLNKNGSFSIFAYPADSLYETQIAFITSPIHCFLNIWKIPFNFEE